MSNNNMRTWDELGFRGIDPEISNRMKKQLSRDDSHSLERELSPYTIRRAAQLVDLKVDSLSERISQKEILRIMRDLKGIGYSVSGYSNMKTRELFGYFRKVQGNIKSQLSRLEQAS